VASLSWYCSWLLKKARKDSRFLFQHLADTLRSPILHQLCIPPVEQDSLVWLGHASTLLSVGGIKILTDPVFSSRVGPRISGYTIGPKRYFGFLSTPELYVPDVVLLSHAHFDHWDLPTLEALSSEVISIVPNGTEDLLPAHLRKQARVLEWGRAYTIYVRGVSTTITALQGEHPGARVRHDNHRTVNAYLIEQGAFRCLFVGDTRFTNNIANSIKQLGVDHLSLSLALFPIGAYNPYHHNHCTPEEALIMAEDLRVTVVVPIHHATFKLSNEPIGEPIVRFRNYATSVRKVILSPDDPVLSLKEVIQAT
jgi:L-ascorbate metabolism protein UlaG (beta-lactamase superfamily)